MTLISSPIRGFLPFLAFLCATLKVPKPARATVSFFFNALVMVEKIQIHRWFIRISFQGDCQ
jgi:hypothetical protein